MQATLTTQADHYARSVVIVEDDTINGGTGADLLDGGSGNDLLMGQGDNRFRFLAQRPAGGINGNEYDALWSAYSGAITIETPTLWFDDSAQTYQVDFQYPSLLGAPQGQLVRVQNGGYPYDITLGAWSNDPQDIPADGATDILLGGTGDDILVGATGTDYLSGGDDHDWLLGYAGNDILDGGRGQEPLGRRSIASPSGLEMRRARQNRKKTAATAKRKPPPRNSLAIAWQRHELHDMQQMKSIGRSLTGPLHSRFERSWGW